MNQKLTGLGIDSFGSGVIGDLAGFAGVTLRGIKVIQVPTTFSRWIVRWRKKGQFRRKNLVEVFTNQAVAIDNRCSKPCRHVNFLLATPSVEIWIDKGSIIF